MTSENNSNPVHQPVPLTAQRISRSQDDDIEIGRYLILFFENWYWFVIAISFFIAAAWFINRKAIKVYQVQATLIIEDESKSPLSSSMFGGGSMVSGLNNYPSWYNFQNQILILKSANLIERTLHNVSFEVSYFNDEFWRPKEIWEETPFVVVPDTSKPQALGITFRVIIVKDGSIKIKNLENGDRIETFNYSTNKKSKVVEKFKIDRPVKFGELLEGEGYAFTIIPRENTLKDEKPAEGSYLFSFNSYESLLQTWSGRLKLSTVDKDASMVRLTVESECPSKAQQFINMHLYMYRLRTLEKKNQFATNTVEFIDKKLNAITDSLKSTEINLQNFKKENQVVDLSFQAQQLFDKAREMDNRKAEVKLKGDYYQYILDYLKKSKDTGGLIAPSVVGIEDPLLTNLVVELNKLMDQKIVITGGGLSTNPYLATLSLEIKNAKATIEEIIRNLINTNSQAVAETEKRLGEIMSEVRKLPQTERELFGIERKFKLNDQIYTYLLQRRAEAQITKASNTPDNEIIDSARLVLPNIKPRPVRNYAIALLMGLFMPGLFFFLKEVFNVKIETEEEVKKIANLPIAGQIAHSRSEYQTIVLHDPHNNISEAFRNVRTRMRFFTREIKNPVILVTSAMPAEGKTFTALNLASAYSLMGAKTVLIGFDLRRPGIFGEFGIDNHKGVSTYLIGTDKLADVIKESGYENLYIISAGPMPPNPSELASSSKVKELIAELKRQFDYIILDSAPIGSVSDTFSLAQVADSVIILVRHNKTNKHLLKDTIEDCRANGINNLCILMNDIRNDARSYGYRGRYGYGYDYGYNYGSNGKSS
jgi:tyrosine-protein kinase Etk/Wzc